MKVWIGHGSEHSANIVMIGRFKDARSKEAAATLIERLREIASREANLAAEDPERHDPERFSKDALDELSKIGFFNITPRELDSFNLEYHLDTDRGEIAVTTDETEIGALLKILIAKGAKVEIFSRHDWADG